MNEIPGGGQKILLCGHRVRLCRERIIELLRSQGHDVYTLLRGAMHVTTMPSAAPSSRCMKIRTLRDPFDIVINYILLKDETVEPNELHMDSLLKFCKQSNVKRLVHISSVSVYGGDVSYVTEDSPIEADPNKKGSYGALKVAQDQWIIKHAPPELMVTFVRPGFVLAPGLISPMIGMAAKMPWNQLLLLGAANNSLPVIRRDLLNQAVAAVVNKKPEKNGEVVLVFDTNSPSRKEWLTACCTILGSGTRVVWAPKLIWFIFAAGAGTVATIMRMKLKPYKIIRNTLRTQQFNSDKTQQKLGVNFATDWRKELPLAMDAQQRNFSIPNSPAAMQPLRAKSVTFIGYGGIVKQKHLPALKWLKFNGKIDAYDVVASTDAETGQQIKAVKDAKAEPTDLFVVASPGKYHNAAIPLLRQVDAPILMEKPLCYTPAELDEWLEFSRSRKSRVMICHNYRFKENVQKMLGFLGTYNPGKIRQVDLVFQSLPVSFHFPAWRRDERGAQTLLIEYAAALSRCRLHVLAGTVGTERPPL